MLDRIRLKREGEMYVVQRRQWLFWWQELEAYTCLEDAFRGAKPYTAGTRQRFITLVDEKVEA